VAKLVSEEFFLQGDLEMEEFKEQPAVRYIAHITRHIIIIIKHKTIDTPKIVNIFILYVSTII
jgi:hypothetical protein